MARSLAAEFGKAVIDQPGGERFAGDRAHRLILGCRRRVTVHSPLVPPQNRCLTQACALPAEVFATSTRVLVQRGVVRECNSWVEKRSEPGSVAPRLGSNSFPLPKPRQSAAKSDDLKGVKRIDKVGVCRDLMCSVRISPIIRVGEVPGSNPGAPTQKTQHMLGFFWAS
jgi:hypothetical protein